MLLLDFTYCYGVFRGYTFIFYIWQKSLMSHVNYDIEGTQDAILHPLQIHTCAQILLEGIWLLDS